MVYKMLFHVRFPTLLLLFIDRRKNKIKKILTNSVKNTDVLFELSDVKVDTSAQSPNKKLVLLICELFKEKWTESNVVKIVLRAIERLTNFYLNAS